MANYKPCACPRRHHEKSLDGGRCHTRVIWNHGSGWCFDCTDECKTWWRVLIARLLPNPSPEKPEADHG